MENSSTRPSKKPYPAAILVILLMFSFFSNEIIAGKNYYFSTLSGDDSRSSTQAQNPATPWKTINKLNSIFSSLQSGDSVLFKRNEIFPGSIKVQKSGSSALPIVISAFGTGANPVITGFTNLTGWVSIGNGVYQSSAPACKSTLNMVALNGTPKAIGRYPNTGYLNFESHAGTTSITDNQLSGTPNWTGAEVVIRKAHWVIDRNLISNHSGNTITYNSSSTYPGIDGYGYFIQNDPKTLDQVGEWYLNPVSKNLQMYFGSTDPSTCLIQASVIDTLVNIDGYNYITFYNLSFEGGNVISILINTADQIKIQKCVINSSGYDAIRISGGSDNSLVDNCTINNTNNTAIYVGVWAGAASTSTITNNKINKTGVVPGMGGNGDDATVGISVDCENSLIQYNEVDTTGYHGIIFDGNNTKVKNNLVNNFCSVKDDGAGIYTWKGGYVTQTGNEVSGNIVLNGIGAPGGTNSTSNKSAMGIYMDDYSQSVSITNNTVSNCVGGGLFMGWYAKNITVSNNTSYNNKYQFWSLRNTTVLPNFSIQNNIFFAKSTDQFVVLIENSSPSEVGTMDFNYQCRPINDDNSFYVSALPEYLQLNINEWRTSYNKDLNSNVSPISITDINDILFEYNATNTNKTVPLPYPYIGVNGVQYTNSVVLAPYTSIILLKNPNGAQNQAPNIQNQSFSISENSPNSTTVGTINASDPDAGQTLSFSILSGNTNGAFAINASTGVLTVANSAAINFEAATSFSLVIKVQDNGIGNLSNQATVTISLTDVNEVPVINNQSFSVVENSANGSTVGTVVATDPDAGQTKTFSILSGNTNGAFAINASSGVITVANSAALNFEATPSFALVVKAQDNGTGSLSSQATVTVSLTDVNEAPVINNQSLSIAENSANGSIVGTVVTTDPDAGQTKTFSILSGNTNGAFVINASSGVLTVANSAALNFEVIPSFALVVKVQDNGSGSLSSQATVTVSLTDVNEVPVINNQSFAIAENSSNGLTVGTIVATDPDAGQTKTFSILSGNANGAFAINATSGILTVANSTALNFEATPSFALVVKVQDNGTGSLSSQATVTVSLTDVNEVPVIGNQSFSTAENSSNGSTVGTVVASDPDAGQTKTFSILSGNTNGAFAINTSTGVLTVSNSAALNFEVTPSFALVIKVQDNGTGSLSSQATVTVSLTDVNEVPVINNQSFAVAENSANGSTVGTVVATDPDAGQTRTFSILSGNTNGAYAINASTGVLTVSNSTVLNFEVIPIFTLVVKVQDNGTGNLSSQANVTISLIDINEAPVVNNQSFNILEFSANGTTVGTLVASDPDAGQTLTYSLQSGNSGNAFAVNPSSGEITVINSAALNPVINPTFALLIKATDNGTGNLFDDATITINVIQTVNQPPVINNQTFAVNENSPNGTTVGAIIAGDPDAGQTLSYSILSGNTSGAFAIIASTGILVVANSAALNFEAIPTLALIVKVQDNGTGNLSSQATVTVSLNDVNEVPLINNQSFTIAENSVNGSTVGTVIATDPDAGQTKTFSILSGNPGNAFSINASTGVLTVANSTALNFEVTPAFSLVVKVQDNGTGNLSNQATVTITLTDLNEAPVINNQSFSVSENSANGTTVGTMIATDPDAGQARTFTILSGNTNGAFAINASSGVLTVANSTALDFETTPTFALVIKVQDNGAGSLSSQATATLSLTDQNETPVITNQSFTIAENSANASTVGTVIATDPDAGQTKTFSILSGNFSGAFLINTSTGVLTVANSAALNFEATPVFSLVVKVQDNGTGNLSSQATITVSLTDVNEAPVISNQSFTVAENSANGYSVGTVIATDPDAGQTRTFSILSGNTGGAFAINASTGVLTVANSAILNFEVTPTFTLTIKVQDNGTGNLSSQATTLISLIDLNEAPIISNQSFDVPEFAANGTIVGSVFASDQDAGQILTYQITSGNSDNAFSLNASTGELTVSNSIALNVSLNPVFSINVKVVDNGTGNLFDEATITINVLQFTNQPPVINNQIFFVNENSINGTIVGTVVANDPDNGQTLTYSILSGNTNGAFTINSSTGVLTVANSASINFEANPVFALVVKAEDNGTLSLSNQATVTVTLNDVNEAPIINNQAFSLVENAANGTITGTVAATDPDAGQTKTFSILSGNAGGAFAINTSTGILTVANSAAINFEANPIFALLIKVQDNGIVNLSSQATVTVTLVNINEPPVVTNQSFILNENAPNGTVAGTFVASDPDAGQTLAFSILSGNVNNDFVINATTGVVTVANSSALNYETNPTFVLLINVQDNGSGNLSSQGTATISLIDQNEPPVINNQSFTLAENTPNGSFVGTVIASDPDAGQTKTFSILSGNANGAFVINSSTGVVTVANSTAINFELNPAFALVVKVQDNGTGSLSSQATVNISLTDVNEVPVISNQLFSVNENSANGLIIGTVAATDPDAGQSTSYSILSGNIGGAFAIGSSTGLIIVANSAMLDYEILPGFNLVVKVQDNGAGNLSSQATIIISIADVNEAPLVNNQQFNVDEFSANGTQVGNVLASDPDGGQILTYAITSGNSSNAFAINNATGAITVNNSVAINTSTNPVFNLNVRVTDDGFGSLFTDAEVIINVMPVINQSPVIHNQEFTINENAANGTSAGTVLANDPNTGQLLAFSIISGNESGAFAINSSSGEITVSNSTELDYENQTTFSLVILVRDNGAPVLGSQATITIKLLNVNELPVINSQSYSTAEHQPVGTQVGIITASDPDLGSLLSYSIISGNAGNGFVLNPITGQLTINNPAAVCYEGHPVFDLMIEVSDTEGLSNAALVTINVTDINESPVCSNQYFSVEENVPAQTTVGTVLANEPDFNQVLTYSIISGNTDNAFSINSQNGLLKVNNPFALNFEENHKFILSVLVQDNGINSLSTVSTVIIEILDVNDPPVMANQSFSVPENSPVGTEIGYLEATDPDHAQAINFKIVGGNENDIFNLNSSTGLLTVSDPTYLTFSLNPFITLMIKAVETGSDSLSTLAFVTINILQQASGLIVYIDPTNENDPAENGSISHPFNSWQDVTFTDGHTYLQKRETTYKSENTITITKSEITIDAYGSGSNPIIYFTVPAENAITLHNPENCTVKNIEINFDQEGLACINISGNTSKSLTIENCQFHGALYGIKSDSQIKELRILNTTIYNTGLDGILADNFESIEVAKCNIYNVNQNWFSVAASNGTCMKLHSDMGSIYIHENEFDHSATGNAFAVQVSGNSIQGLIESNTIKGRKITGNQCLGLSNNNGLFIVRYNTLIGGETGIFSNAFSCKVYYNQIIGNSTGITVGQNKAVNVLNNTFYSNELSSIESFAGSKVFSKNNIYYLSPTSLKAYDFEGTYVSDYNVFNIEKQGFLCGFNTLSSWKTSTGQDQHSMITNPQFVNAETFNLRIKHNSPCINKGVELNLEKDFFATLVPQAGIPDIGFCELEAVNIQSETDTIPVANDKSLVNISIYPNPSAGLIKIDLQDAGDQQVSIRITDMNGYEVYNTITQGQKIVEINMDEQKTGTYLALVTINGHIQSKRIIVQN